MFSNPNKKKNKSQNKNILPKNYQQPYLVVPYYQGLSEVAKEPVANMEYKFILKEVLPSRASWWHQKIQTPC